MQRTREKATKNVGLKEKDPEGHAKKGYWGKVLKRKPKLEAFKQKTGLGGLSIKRGPELLKKQPYRGATGRNLENRYVIYGPRTPRICHLRRGTPHGKLEGL